MWGCKKLTISPFGVKQNCCFCYIIFYVKGENYEKIFKNSNSCTFASPCAIGFAACGNNSNSGSGGSGGSGSGTGGSGSGTGGGTGGGITYQTTWPTSTQMAEYGFSVSQPSEVTNIKCMEYATDDDETGLTISMESATSEIYNNLCSAFFNDGAKKDCDDYIMQANYELLQRTADSVHLFGALKDSEEENVFWDVFISYNTVASTGLNANTITISMSKNDLSDQIPTWSNIYFANYDLQGLTKPDGATVIYIDEMEASLIINLNATKDNFDSLITQITNKGFVNDTESSVDYNANEKTATYVGIATNWEITVKFNGNGLDLCDGEFTYTISISVNSLDY